MRDSRLLPTVKPELRPGSRTTAGERHRLSLADTPEHQRLAHFREFCAGLALRFDVEPTYAPVEIDLTLQALPGLKLMSGRMQGLRYRRSSKDTDPTEDIGLIVNSKGQHLVAQRGQEVMLGAGDAALISLAEPIETIHTPRAISSHCAFR